MSEPLKNPITDLLVKIGVTAPFETVVSAIFGLVEKYRDTMSQENRNVVDGLIAFVTLAVFRKMWGDLRKIDGSVPELPPDFDQRIRRGYYLEAPNGPAEN